MQILVRVPASVLILMSESVEADSRLKQLAGAHGISGTRLILLPRLRKESYYALLGYSDLFLDTRYYGAHTIASDCMLYGTPVLTMSGSTFASRVAHSLNAVVGTQDILVSHGRREYVDMAVRIMNEASMMRSMVRARVQAAVKSGENCFYNSQKFTVGLERAYLGVVDLKRLEINPRHIFFERDFVQQHCGIINM
jgi:protein O-GlcNAc transferase